MTDIVRQAADRRWRCWFMLGRVYAASGRDEQCAVDFARLARVEGLAAGEADEALALLLGQGLLAPAEQGRVSLSARGISEVERAARERTPWAA